MQTYYKNDCAIIEYRQPKQKSQRRFNLEVEYLGGTFIAFTLVTERRKAGVLKLLCIEIDEDNTTADIEDATRDLSDVRWYIFPTKERGRKIPPMITFWEKEDIVVAACLSDRYTSERIAFSEQTSPENKSPEQIKNIEEREVCWWPNKEDWQTAKNILKIPFPFKSVALPFFTLTEWLRRADVSKRLEKYFAEFLEDDDFDDPEVLSEIFSDIKAEEYAVYMRRLQTQILCFQKNNFPVNIVRGDAAQAEEFFKEKGLDPLAPSSWAKAASTAFEKMPNFLVESQMACGPIGIVSEAQNLKAMVMLHSHWPGVSSIPDMATLTIFSGAKPLKHTAFWFNPLCREGSVNNAFKSINERIQEMGIEETIMADKVYQLRAYANTDNLSIFTPVEWSTKENHQKVGRNDPCPCGSGAKYKKCCGVDDTY